MALYKVRVGTDSGEVVTIMARGYLEAYSKAQELAAKNQRCALVYVDTPDGWKVKNTVAPDGRRIKNA